MTKTVVGKPNGHVATAKRLLGRAEYLAAYDEAARALEDAPSDIVLQHLAILALARAGATEQAAQRFIRDGLARRVRMLEPALAEDILALEARIAKDRALTGPSENLQALSEVAAASYERVHRRFGRTYTAVNAATMWMLAGNEKRARGLARRVLRLLPALGDGDYWQEASRAEALITLGDAVRAREALAAAAQSTGADVASRSTTRRQLLTLCTHTGIDDEILDGLPVPRSMHYCGHVPASERLQGSDEKRVVDEVRQWLNDQGDVIAYGSLAAGADIIIAEAVIASGCELHVVLPFPSEEFEETSVLPFGEGWSKRYHRCLAAAETVTEATGSRQGEDDAAYAYCSSIAMGRAVIRSHVLARAPLQLAVWDGRDTDRIGGARCVINTFQHSSKVS
jgi:tetratricopeptide (TPR) repeat protein